MVTVAGKAFVDAINENASRARINVIVAYYNMRGRKSFRDARRYAMLTAHALIENNADGPKEAAERIAASTEKFTSPETKRAVMEILWNQHEARMPTRQPR